MNKVVAMYEADWKYIYFILKDATKITVTNLTFVSV